MGLQSCTIKLSPFSILRPLSRPSKLPTPLNRLPHRFHYVHSSRPLPLLARALSSAAAAAPQPTTSPISASETNDNKGAIFVEAHHSDVPFDFWGSRASFFCYGWNFLFFILKIWVPFLY